MLINYPLESNSIANAPNYCEKGEYIIPKSQWNNEEV